ncbi:FliO/MopB family protein [bacterium]|nr:FliO/MopB family protein [bacterium]
MSNYISHFAVYLFAMVGFICVALLIVKKSVVGGFSKKTSSFLQVEDTITIAPKKSLYVIKAGEKKLLIASDEGRTTFLTELNEKEKLQKSIEQMTSKLQGVKINTNTKEKTPVMRELLTKLK